MKLVAFIALGLFAASTLYAAPSPTAAPSASTTPTPSVTPTPAKYEQTGAIAGSQVAYGMGSDNFIHRLLVDSNGYLQVALSGASSLASLNVSGHTNLNTQTTSGIAQFGSSVNMVGPLAVTNRANFSAVTATGTVQFDGDMTISGRIYGGETIAKTLYVDGNRTDAYTADGTSSKPYKTVKEAFVAAAALSPTSTNRISIFLENDFYTEDNPIAGLSYVFTEGRFKHNPRIIPANNDKSLFLYQSTTPVSAGGNWASCDFGNITFYAPTGAGTAAFDFQSSTNAVLGMYECLVWGRGANSIGFNHQSNGGGIHCVNCMSYGDFDIYANMVGGNWRDTGHIGHFGSATNKYLYMAGDGNHSEVDLLISNTDSVQNFYHVNNATSTLLISNAVSFSTNTDLYLQAGTVQVNGSNWRGKTIVDGSSNLYVSASTFDNGSEYAIKSATTGIFHLANSRVESGGTDNTIQFSAQPSSLEINGSSMMGGGAYSVYASAPITGLFSGNSLQDGVNSNITDSSTSTRAVPALYKTIQEAISAASAGDEVYVEAGSYDESLDIAAAITIRGQGKSTTTIFSAQTLINSIVSDTRIKDLTLQASGTKPIYYRNLLGDFDDWVYFENCNIVGNDEPNNAVQLVGQGHMLDLDTCSVSGFSEGGYAFINNYGDPLGEGSGGMWIVMDECTTTYPAYIYNNDGILSITDSSLAGSMYCLNNHRTGLYRTTFADNPGQPIGVTFSEATACIYTEGFSSLAIEDCSTWISPGASASASFIRLIGNESGGGSLTLKRSVFATEEDLSRWITQVNSGVTVAALGYFGVDGIPLSYIDDTFRARITEFKIGDALFATESTNNFVITTASDKAPYFTNGATFNFPDNDGVIRHVVGGIIVAPTPTPSATPTPAPSPSPAP